MMHRERVLLVEDHAGTGDALAAMLRRWFDVPHRIGSLAELSEAMRVQEPTIVLIDLALGDQNVLEVLPELVSCYPLKKFIVLTAYDSFAVMEGALKAGAKGFVPKSATIEEIKEAITVVAAGNLHKHHGVRRVAPSRQSAAPARNVDCDELVVPKPAELEVLALLRDGVSGREIARRLKLHHRTVEERVRRIGKRLGGLRRVGVLRWYEEYLARRGK